MRFNVLVENHLGATHTRAVCEPCAARFPGRLLRDPGRGERDATTGRLLAGPVTVRESEHGECSECSAGRAPVGYLRCCAFCNVDLLLDHEVSNEVPVYCPKHADPAARR